MRGRPLRARGSAHSARVPPPPQRCSPRARHRYWTENSDNLREIPPKWRAVEIRGDDPPSDDASTADAAADDASTADAAA